MFTPYFHENRPLKGQGVEKVREHERLLTLVLDLLSLLCMLWEMTVKQTHVFKRKRDVFTATNENKLSLERSKILHDPFCVSVFKFEQPISRLKLLVQTSTNHQNDRNFVLITILVFNIPLTCLIMTQNVKKRDEFWIKILELSHSK